LVDIEIGVGRMVEERWTTAYLIMMFLKIRRK